MDLAHIIMARGAYRDPALATDDDRASARHFFASTTPRLRETFRREARWLKSYEEVADYCTTGEPLPPRLESWIKNQRRGKLCEMQLALLEDLPIWEWHPRREAWNARADDLDTFITRHRRLPRIRATDPDEQSLGRWLGHQRRRLNRGRLDILRARRLTYILDRV